MADALEITQNISAWRLFASRVYTSGVELDAFVDVREINVGDAVLHTSKSIIGAVEGSRTPNEYEACVKRPTGCRGVHDRESFKVNMYLHLRQVSAPDVDRCVHSQAAYR